MCVCVCVCVCVSMCSVCVCVCVCVLCVCEFVSRVCCAADKYLSNVKTEPLGAAGNQLKISVASTRILIGSRWKLGDDARRDRNRKQVRAVEQSARNACPLAQGLKQKKADEFRRRQSIVRGHTTAESFGMLRPSEQQARQLSKAEKEKLKAVDRELAEIAALQKRLDERRAKAEKIRRALVHGTDAQQTQQKHNLGPKVRASRTSESGHAGKRLRHASELQKSTLPFVKRLRRTAESSLAVMQAQVAAAKEKTKNKKRRRSGAGDTALPEKKK